MSRQFSEQHRLNLSRAHRKRCEHPEELQRLRFLASSTVVAMVGRRFGKWTVVSADPVKDKYGKKWICHCECGSRTSIFGQALRCGSTKSCGCDRKWERRPGTALGKLFRRYEYTAKRRGIDWSLTLEEFTSLISSPCYYTGRSPSTRCVARGGEVILWNGVDRKDSSRGYTVENCVPCCSEVNMAKNIMDESTFLAMVRAVYERRCACSS